MVDPKELVKLYKRYGFEERKTRKVDVYVFSIKSGHYHNADIVTIKNNVDITDVFDDFKSAGYACQSRHYESIKDIENELFSGFFTVSGSRKRLLKEYEKFTKNIVGTYSDDATYSYINTRYFIDGELGEKGVVGEIVDRINASKPILFLIEAAAGFGKTCTSYELLKELVTGAVNKIPLFSELAKNRQAKIFRYVLLDEIDRTFPQLSSKLVNAEIKSGKVPVILDGFDELLHRSDDSKEYENTEPMLETIGELLKNKAKVVLTTRRTAIFDGDDFHEWMNAHEDDFEIIRIRLDEPSVDDWLPQERLERLVNISFPIRNLSNPVLLSFLRCISDKEFEDVISDPDSIVEKYFTSMLEREQVRQDLRISPKKQYEILKSLAVDMIKYNYTAESREYILSCILDGHGKEIENSRKNYSSDERPTLDELVNKLASHALLDRSSDSEQGIGFVNDFVLGNFSAECILEDTSGEWSGDQRFIEPAVISYVPRNNIRKYSLWLAVKFRLEFCDAAERLLNTIRLTNEAIIDLVGESIDGVTIYGVVFGKGARIKETLFINCMFKNVTFSSAELCDVTFANCSFYDCYVEDEYSGVNINVFGGVADEKLIRKMVDEREKIHGEESVSREHECDIYVMEKFWPKGRHAYTYKHRPIKGVCAKNNKFTSAEILEAITRLKVNEFLLEPEKLSFLEINVRKLTEIMEFLGRS